MKYPDFIKKGECIGVPAPSGGAWNEKKANKFKNASKNISELGYKLILSDNLHSNEMGRSADAKIRGEEFNEMLKNPDIKLVLCATGGDFLLEMLPYVDFNLLKDNLKLIAGFSDPTGLLYPITTKYDIATLYGQNFSPFGMEKLHESQNNFLEIVKGNIVEQKSFDKYENESLDSITGLEYYNLDTKVKYKTLDNKDVNIKGRIIGGCLDLITELAGTKYDGTLSFIEKYKDDGIIWYFDNCELSMESFIRTMWKFNEMGYFKYTKGIILGRFGEEKSYYDYDVKSCIEDSVLSKLDFPIIYDADISHKSPSWTIINGAIATISVSDGKGKIEFDLK